MLFTFLCLALLITSGELKTLCLIRCLHFTRLADLLPISTQPPKIKVKHQEVVVENSFMKQIDDNVFDGYLNVEAVQFKHTRITKVSSTAFVSTKLKYLSLRYNNLIWVPDLSVVASTLEILDLRNNNISTFANFVGIEHVAETKQ